MAKYDILENIIFDSISVDDLPLRELDVTTTSFEKDYIDICFIELLDNNSYFSALTRIGNVDISITIESIRNNTFSSYKTYYDEIYEKMNMIEESILKVKIKYPHCNIVTTVTTYIGLTIMI